MKTDQDYRDKYSRRELEFSKSNPEGRTGITFDDMEDFRAPSHVWLWTCAVVASGVFGIIIGYCSRVQ